MMFNACAQTLPTVAIDPEKPEVSSPNPITRQRPCVDATQLTEA